MKAPSLLVATALMAVAWAPLPCRGLHDGPWKTRAGAEEHRHGIVNCTWGGAVGISIDSESGERVAAFLRAAGVTYPNLLDSRRRLAEEFGVRVAVPQIFLLDRRGIVVQHSYGGPLNRVQEAALTDTIRALLASS